MGARAVNSGPFEALGDSNRREILRILGEGERSVQEIAGELPISRPAVSRHLKLLSDAGLVSSDRRGTRQVYQLRQDGIEAVQAYLETVWGDVAIRFRLMAENTSKIGSARMARTGANSTSAAGPECFRTTSRRRKRTSRGLRHLRPRLPRRADGALLGNAREQTSVAAVNPAE
jgi:DNA-binding transcriptional ArsR family regulator